MHFHRDLRPVRQYEFRMRTKLLDVAENVVPAPAVQSRGMVAQFVKNLVHLERRQNGFDQHGGANRSSRNAKFVLGKTEHVIPQTGFQVILQLRQIEVRTSSFVQQGPGVVKKEQTKIKQ